MKGFAEDDSGVGVLSWSTELGEEGIKGRE